MQLKIFNFYLEIKNLLVLRFTSIHVSKQITKSVDTVSAFFFYLNLHFSKITFFLVLLRNYLVLLPEIEENQKHCCTRLINALIVCS